MMVIIEGDDKQKTEKEAEPNHIRQVETIEEDMLSSKGMTNVTGLAVIEGDDKRDWSCCHRRG
jgi:hypothetical protein